MSASLSAKALLVWVKVVEVLPESLNSAGDHADPHFLDAFE